MPAAPPRVLLDYRATPSLHRLNYQDNFLPEYREAEHAYHRLCAPGMLSLKARRALRDRYESLDPFALKEELEARLKQIRKPKTLMEQS